MKKYLLLLALVFAPLLLNAQDSSWAKAFEGLKFNGLFDIIPYFDGRDFSNDTYVESFITSKIRFGIEKTIGSHTLAAVKLQDSRVWGTEKNLSDNQKNVDMVEGYIKFLDILNVPLALQLGRFQMDYGTGRFIGYSSWNYYERTFDGLRLGYKTKRFSIDYFHTLHTASVTVQRRDALPGAFAYPVAPYNAYNILGLWGNVNISDKHTIDAFAYYEINSKKSDTTDYDLDRANAGFDYIGNFGPVGLTAEFGYQFGEQSGTIINAFTASLKCDMKVKSFRFFIGEDVLSGTDPRDSVPRMNTYDNYLATKHRLYGNMDYFSNSVSGTAGLGLYDSYIGASYGSKTDPLNLSLTEHYFMSEFTSLSGNSKFGLETDLTVKYNIAKGVSVEWTNGLFVPGEMMKENFAIRDKKGNQTATRYDLGYDSYIRAIVSF